MSEIRIEDHSEELLKAKDEAVIQFLLEAGLHLETEAKLALEMDPRRVDTGLLRNSIAYALDGEPPDIQTYKADKGGETGSYSGAMPEEGQGKRAVYWGTNVEYAAYVHEGTIKMAPNRFLKNAFEANKDQLKEKLKEALENA